MTRNLRLGTRGSPLALYQANTVAALLNQDDSVTCEIVIIKTSGDRLAEASLSAIGGKRLFVKEIEDALLTGETDLAVHSSKDMPVVLPDGLDIGAVLARADARDALVLPNEPAVDLSLEDVVARLGQAPRIGTSSVRRIAQLSRLFPRATFHAIRGNVDTRLRKVDTGDFDAIVLAAAGLDRLEHEHRISARIPVLACVPAPGQGIIAIEIRSEDHALRQLLQRIDDAAAATALKAERTVVVRLGGGCQMPIGAYATLNGAMLHMVAVVVSLDGTRAVRVEIEEPTADPIAAGAAAADRLLADGAGEILADVERLQGTAGELQS